MDEVSSTAASDVGRGVVGTKANLAIPFVVAIIVGGGLVVWSPSMWPLALCVMVGYLVWGLHSAQRAGYVLEFADSFYYLGFTLTLMALIGALEPFELTAGGAAPDAESVLHHFGLGLLTTLVGVVGRTVLQMFYRTPDENVEATNQQIAAAAAQYLDQLEALNARAGSVLDDTLHELSATLHGRVESVGASLDGIIGSLARISSGLEAPDTADLQRRLDALGASIEAAGKSFQEHVEAIERGTAQHELVLGASTEGVRAFTDALDRQVGRWSQSLTGSKGALDAFSDRLSSITVDGAQIKDTVAQVSAGITENGHRLKHSLDTVSGSLMAVANGVRDANEHVASRQFDRLEAVLGSLSEQFQHTVRLLATADDKLAGDTLPRIRANLDAFADETERVIAVLDEVVDAARRRLEAIR